MKNLTNEELIEKYKENNDIEIRNYIIIKNIGLIKSITKKYSNNYLVFDDIFQEGVIGMINAIENYNKSLKCKFSTYASKSITNCIKTYIYQNDSMLSVCIYLCEQINKYKYFKSLNLSNDEIKKRMNLSDQQFGKFLKKYNMSIKKIVSANSLNNEETEIINNLKAYDNTSEVTEKIYREEFISTLKNNLTKRQFEEVLLRYGFATDYEMKSSEISEKMNITTTRTNQLDNTAIKKLKLCSEIIEYYK